MPRPFNQVLYDAKTLGELDIAYNASHAELVRDHRGRSIKQQDAVYKKLRNKFTGGTSGTTTTLGGTVIVPTVSTLYDELKKQGLQLVGLGQQVQTSNAIAPPKATGGGFDWSTLLLLGGGALAVFYFFRSR